MYQVILEEQTPELLPMNKPKEFVEKNKKKLKDFLNFAKSRIVAAGLASNQCSLYGERIKDRYVAINVEGEWILAVDPKVIKKVGDLVECDEGCLTWPGKTIVANRYPEIKVEFYTIKGIIHTRHVKNLFEAQVWQHEINHLNGIEEDVREDGFRTYRRSKPKVSRNAPCPCGSKVKYKHCCWNKK